MSYLTNLVNELHDISLKDFSEVSEVSDITEPENSINLLSFYHWINVSLHPDIFSDDFSTRISQTQS